MSDLPAPDLRSNLGTWAVPPAALPALARLLTQALPPEPYDPDFRGQYLETTYLDNTDFSLLKARQKGNRYLTLRVRCYSPPYAPGKYGQNSEERYALSVKTESEKFRTPVSTDQAELLLASGLPYPSAYDLLPPHLQSRLQDLTGDDQAVVGVLTVCGRRYAVEDAIDRYTLDVDVRTDTGKCLPFAVLEYKSTRQANQPPGRPDAELHLRPIKLSKYLWAGRQNP
jgi:hypothetical protein